MYCKSRMLIFWCYRPLTAAEADAVYDKLKKDYKSALVQQLPVQDMLSDDPGRFLDPEDMLMRFGRGPLPPDLAHWYPTAPIGSVRLTQGRSRNLGDKVLHSFANVHSEAVHMLPGSTHVAIGFADLGSLAAAVSKWKPDEQGHWIAEPFDTLGEGQEQEVPAGHLHAYQLLQQAGSFNSPLKASSTSSSSSGNEVSFAEAINDQNDSRSIASAGPNSAPLLWVGYDASAYVVAKTAVLVEMMALDAHEDHVLQVREAGGNERARVLRLDSTCPSICVTCV